MHTFILRLCRWCQVKSFLLANSATLLDPDPINVNILLRLWLVSISDEDSLSEIALSGASKLASAYFTLFYRSVHVLYTGIYIYKNICINVCIIKIHVPRAHEVKNQRVIAKRTSQIMKYGQDVIIQQEQH